MEQQAEVKGVPPELCLELLDDWYKRGHLPHEKLVMKIESVVYLSPLQKVTTGTLVMTNYQVFFQPYKNCRLDPGVGLSHVSVPLGTIARVEKDKMRGTAQVMSGNEVTMCITLYCKDLRVIRYGFDASDTCKNAYNVLQQYVFPSKIDYMFAFYYKLSEPVPDNLDGWKLFDPEREFKRMGLPNDIYHLSEINKNYDLCSTYPSVLCTFRPELVAESELYSIASFRSRGRLPCLTWKHPTKSSCMWRCSQPRVGMNSTRSTDDEKLFALIRHYNKEADVGFFFFFLFIFLFFRLCLLPLSFSFPLHPPLRHLSLTLPTPSSLPENHDLRRPSEDQRPW